MRSNGFTLLELMVALAILGILLAIGVPAFGTVIDNQRMDDGVNGLVRSLNYTRTEAVRRNRPVTVSPIDADWNAGWRIFLDRNNNGLYDAGETLLREDIPADVAFVHANTNVGSYVRYNPHGESVLLNGGFQAGTFRFCPRKAEAQGRKLIINRIGRVRLEREVIDTQYCSG